MNSSPPAPVNSASAVTSTPKRPLWQRWLISLLRRWFGKRVVRLHYQLFDWHCKTFFPLQEHITPREWDYLETCFQLVQIAPDIPHDTGYSEYSSFSYSHRVEGEQVNSSRMAFGSLQNPQRALASAIPILQERNIDLDPFFLESPDSLFYGLGWDFLERHFKVYFRVLQFDALPQESLRTLLESAPSPEYRQEGLISFTYKDNQLFEEKVYIYPQPEASPHRDLFPGTKGRVWMSTSRRGTLTQYDVSHPKHWQERMNDTGKQLLATYAQQGYSLDTITMQDNEHFTLYFPGAFFPFFKSTK